VLAYITEKLAEIVSDSAPAGLDVGALLQEVLQERGAVLLQQRAGGRGEPEVHATARGSSGVATEAANRREGEAARALAVVGAAETVRMDDAATAWERAAGSVFHVAILSVPDANVNVP
jgi:uncharacterized protein YaiE (UPF0345 family)